MILILDVQRTVRIMAQYYVPFSSYTRIFLRKTQMKSNMLEIRQEFFSCKWYTLNSAYLRLKCNLLVTVSEKAKGLCTS